MPLLSNSRMYSFSARTAATLAFASAAAFAQTPGSMLPPTAPTSAAAQPAPIAATPVSAADRVPRYRARVTYAAGLLSVQANNSSLNGILRDIARVTGMKITGGIAEQRVFGNYGPAAPSTILATLLDGTGSNMLIRETPDNGPKELVLTARSGGPTPPNPAAAAMESDSEQYAADSSRQAQPQQQSQSQYVSGQATAQQPQGQQPTSGPQPIPQPLNNVLGNPNNTTPTASSIPTVQSIPTDALSTPSTAQPVSGIVDSTNPPPAGATGFGSSTPTDPAVNAPKTPEQIMQQLQMLQAQHQAAQGGSSSGTSTTPATSNPPQ